MGDDIQEDGDINMEDGNEEDIENAVNAQMQQGFMNMNNVNDNTNNSNDGDPGMDSRVDNNVNNANNNNNPNNGNANANANENVNNPNNVNPNQQNANNANKKEEKKVIKPPPWHNCKYITPELRKFIVINWFNELCPNNNDANEIIKPKIIDRIIAYSNCRYIKLECKYINIKNLIGNGLKNMNDKKFANQMKKQYFINCYECINYLDLLKYCPIKHLKKNYHHFYLNPYFNKAHIQIIEKGIKYNFTEIKEYYIKNKKINESSIKVDQNEFKQQICFKKLDSSNIIVAIDDI